MHHHILIPVALDHEQLVGRKIATARRLLDEGGRITLLTVLEDVPGFVAEFIEMRPENDLRARIKARLDEASGDAGDITTEVASGKAGVRIAAFAREHGVDLIIVGSHHPAAQDYFLGSTAARAVLRLHPPMTVGGASVVASGRQRPFSERDQQGRKIMKTRLSGLIAGASAAVAMAGAAFAQDVTIGHFGNPTPMQVARAEGAFETATGWDIEWRQFASGSDVIAAMASGDVAIAELGSSPLAIAASQGVELQLFMLAQVIGTAESLIVRDGAEIAEVADLAGKRVAVPVGSTAHFSLMGALQHAGVGEGDVTIMNMPPDQIAAAWEQDAIDAAFIWQPVQSQLLQSGTLLVGADETAEWGFPTFDGWVVNSAFAAENTEALTAFARTMNEANLAYLNDPGAWTADSEPVQTITTQTGASADQVPGILEGFSFVPLADQTGETWLGRAPATMQATAEFLKEAGRIDTARDDYAPFVNTDIATAAAE